MPDRRARERLDEHLGHALLQVGVGKICQRLSRDGKDFLLAAAEDRLIQVALFDLQRFLAFGTQRVGILSSCVEQSLSFGSGLFRGLFQERSTLLVEGLVLVLQIVPLLLCVSLIRLGLRELDGNPFFPLVNRVEDGLV